MSNYMRNKRASGGHRELTGEIIRETDKALQLKFTDDDDIERIEWFPLSQIKEIHRGDEDVIHVSEWIYAQKEQSWN
jgi:hypothetical protein